MSNDNDNLDWAPDGDGREIVAICNEPLRVAIVGEEILISTNSTPSLTADAAELTGRRLIEAALDLRERERINLVEPAIGRALRLA